jgi:hypothetical protein
MFLARFIVCLSLSWCMSAWLASAALAQWGRPPAAPAQAQGRQPYQKSDLVEVLRKARQQGVADKKFSRLIVRSVRQRGVAFELSEQEAAELTAVGAQPELVAAVRDSYRPSRVRREAASSGRNSRPASVPVGPALSGSVLSVEEIADWLRRGVAVERLEAAVAARGVSFVLRPEQASVLYAAGGTDSLLRAVRNAATAEAKAAEVARLYQAAQQAVFNDSSQNWQRADELLHEALGLFPTQMEARRLHGFVKLYGFRQWAEAEQEMRAAMSFGGEAAFLVSHDCGDRQCGGLLMVGKSSVSYKPQGSGHPFEVQDSGIKEVGVNSWKGVENGWFHVKLYGKNYNFQPFTASRTEAEMIVRLINSY